MMTYQPPSCSWMCQYLRPAANASWRASSWLSLGPPVQGNSSRPAVLSGARYEGIMPNASEKHYGEHASAP